MKVNLFYKKLFSAFLFFVVWQMGSLNYPSIILPSPIEVLIALKKLFTMESFYGDLWVTVFRGIVGYIISMLIGIVFATVFYIKPIFKNIVYPYIMVLQSVPRISWMLLAMVWLPFNSSIIIFILIITLLPTVIMNIYESYNNIDMELLDMARVFEVTDFSILKNIYLPSVTTAIISTSKITLGIMWKTVIMAELLTVQNGLGARLGYLRTALATDQIIAITVVVIILNVICQKFLDKIYLKVERWKISDGVDKV